MDVRRHCGGDCIEPLTLIVHVGGNPVRSFYLHLVPEFELSPTDDLHLVLLMKNIRKTLG